MGQTRYKAMIEVAFRDGAIQKYKNIDYARLDADLYSITWKQPNKDCSITIPLDVIKWIYVEDHHED